MDNIYKISKFIQHHITGKANEEEKQHVEKWIAESERHRQMIEAFQEDAYWQKEKSEHQQIDSDKAFHRFLAMKRKQRQRKLAYWWAAAAAIVIIIGISFFTGQKDSNSIPRQQNLLSEIKPGSSKAVLVLGNGIKMALKDSTSIQFTEETANINIENGQVSYQRAKEDSIRKSIVNTVYTPQGGEYKLTLADGTKVWLNAESRINFPTVFKGREREVTVEGEVYFEVAKDSLHPFKVHTGEAVITVVGTSFNVRNYPEEAHRITLAEGKVLVEHQGQIMSINPGEQWIKDEEGVHVQQVDAHSICRWKEGAFVFKDCMLKDVFRELERWYNIHVFYGNSGVEELPFTGIFPRYGEFNKVLSIIELASCVKCKINNKTLTVYADNE